MTTDWDIDEQATPAQRRSLYRFVLTDQSAVKDLIRSMTRSEADTLLKLLVAADNRSRGSRAVVVDPEVEAMLLDA